MREHRRSIPSFYIYDLVRCAAAARQSPRQFPTARTFAIRGFSSSVLGQRSFESTTFGCVYWVCVLEFQSLDYSVDA
jgi:hypothetical protein